MEYKRKITKITLDGFGDIHLRSLSAGLRLRIVEIQSQDCIEAAKSIRSMAEAVTACWVDESGRQILSNIDEALNEMELDLFNAISAKIIELYIAGEAEKNSESAQVYSSPSSLPEN